MNNMKYKLDVTAFIAATTQFNLPGAGDNGILADLVREAVWSFLGLSHTPCNSKITRFLRDLKVIVPVENVGGYAQDHYEGNFPSGQLNS